MNISYGKNDFPDFNRSEIRRYMGDRNKNALIDNIVEECIYECKDSFDYRVCYGIYDITINSDIVDFGFVSVNSKNLAFNLNNCSKAILFAATCGIKIDRLVKSYSNISPIKSLCFNSIGAERIEALCDKFNESITDKYIYTKPRFSPGYGDLDISFQKNIFKELSCESNIGLFISDSLQMVPSKSVTAIIGVYNESN